MRRIIVLCMLVASIQFLFPTPAEAQTLPHQVIGHIDSVFAPWNTKHSPGAIIGVIHKGKLIHQQAYGMADVERKKVLTTSHSFWVASVAKQFTAMCIALLAEQGKLSLEDDIRKYLPQIPFLGDTIRIKHLVYHTSGLRDGFTLIGLTFHGEKHYTNQNVLQALTRQQALNFRPGERFEYNNGGYVLLAEIVSQASGKSFPLFAEENIFKPLGMTQTRFYGQITKDIPHAAQGYAVKYGKKGVTYHQGSFKGNTVGSSGLVTTLEDICKWDQNFYQNRLGKGKPGLITQITTPALLNNGTPVPYAFGLEIEPYKGQLAITHSGADKGFKAEIVRLPEQEFSIICLTNADNLYSLTARLLHLTETILPDAFEKHTNSIAYHENNTAQLENIAGYYLNPVNQADVRIISVRENNLFAAQSVGGYQHPLVAAGPDTFVNKGLREYTYQFAVNENDGVSLLHYRERANTYKLVKIKPNNVPVKELKKYTGKYYSPELNKYYRLTLRKGKLGLRLFLLFHIPFQPMEGNLFLASLMGNNSFVFRQDNSDKITGFRMNRESIHNFEFTKIK